MRASFLLWLPLATGFVVRPAIVGPASPLTCQTGPRAVGWPVVPQISMVGTGAGEQKLRPVLLAITGATATSAGIVARVFGLSTSVVGSVVGLGGFAITATSLMKWWQDRDATLRTRQPGCSSTPGSSFRARREPCPCHGSSSPESSARHLREQHT